ncbi:hypothetical protein PCASD_16660 [Puccinia coronata f. sp. avenae]|uniref:Uncharacterized protein n=1 Tax=Puccinia coronata f. sp. avenae TaxID=200324 RepID=A0A2N5SBB4_9BASI|nr:hypothetical protein PCASD_16660 [Puccinia coronata f. sp. avenae]
MSSTKPARIGFDGTVPYSRFDCARQIVLRGKIVYAFSTECPAMSGQSISSNEQPRIRKEELDYEVPFLFRRGTSPLRSLRDPGAMTPSSRPSSLRTIPPPHPPE